MTEERPAEAALFALRKQGPQSDITYRIHKEACRYAEGTLKTQERVVFEMRRDHVDPLRLRMCEACGSIDDVVAIRKLMGWRP